jgi:hypothetical protein
MSNAVRTEVWKKYIEFRTKRGLTLAETCKIQGMPGPQTAKLFEAGDPKSSGHHLYQLFKGAGEAEDGGLSNLPIPLEALGQEAKRGLADFDYFSLRYFGMQNSPWMSEANEVMDRNWRIDDDRRYLVVNMHPEAGKTQFVHRKMAQLTIKDRAIQGLIGSFANKMAWNMMTAVGNTFTRSAPWKATEMALRGGAQDAESTLWQDYGRFKPEEARRWNREELMVLQHGGQALAGKEATWQSYGRESGMNLGSRYDFILWDDLVTLRAMGKDPSTTEDLLFWWDTEGETRLNMGGLLVLLGQRISSTDLYRHNLDKMGFVEGEELDLVPSGKKYIHLCYPAHNEEECKKDEEGKPINHGRNAPPWRPDGTGGCILEPRRVSWNMQQGIKLNRADHYATQYQQEDGDPSSVLIPKLWIAGGTDPETSEKYPGCWDNDRSFWQVPEGLSRPIGVITVDPSPTKYWGIQAWVYVPDPNAIKREDGSAGGMRYLVCMNNSKMEAPKFLEYHSTTRKYTGLLDEWYDNYQSMGVKLKWVIFEEAAAQRWALQYETIKQWYTWHDVKVIGHKTHGVNKPDPQLGIPMLKPPYRDGRVRLPRRSFTQMRDMLHQLNSYNDNYRGETDQVMSNWFLESNLRTIVRRQTEEPPPTNPAASLLVPKHFDPRLVMQR